MWRDIGVRGSGQSKTVQGAIRGAGIVQCVGQVGFKGTRKTRSMKVDISGKDYRMFKTLNFKILNIQNVCVS